MRVIRLNGNAIPAKENNKACQTGTTFFTLRIIPRTNTLKGKSGPDEKSNNCDVTG